MTDIVDITELAFFCLNQQKRIEQLVYGLDDVLYGTVGPVTGPDNKEAVLHERFLEELSQKIFNAEHAEAMKKAVISSVDCIANMVSYYKENVINPPLHSPAKEYWEAREKTVDRLSNILTTETFLQSVDVYYQSFVQLSQFLETQNGVSLSQHATMKIKR